jgi:hypothetical protein
MKKKKQHHLWRRYLEAWAATKHRFFMLRNNVVIPTRTFDVGSQNLFYKLERLTDKDLFVIRHLATQATDKQMRALTETFIKRFTLPFLLRDALDPSHPDAENLNREIDEMIANTDEDIHSDLENDAAPAMKRLMEDDLSVFQTPTSIPFYRFIAVQHFRTQALREKIIEITANSAPFNVTTRSYPILSHIFSINTGISNYRERHLHRFVLLRNNSGYPFITSDQPLTNLLAPGDGTMPEHLEWFWPLSPTRALILSPRRDVFREQFVDVLVEEVRTYNRLVFAKSYEQVYSNSREVLEEFVVPEKIILAG